MKRAHFILAAAAVAALATGLGCNDLMLADKGDTQATWANFGEAFFGSYCARCHAGSGSRAFALLTYEQVYAHRGGIKEAAGAGNYEMPTDWPRPTAEERERLSDWIDAGCPRGDAATGDDDSDGDDSGGDDTGGGTDLTWSNFGEPFFADYCTRCHASGGSQSPLETYDQVYAKRATIRSVAGVGTSMPVGNPKPGAAERSDLVTWIDAGCPQ